VVRADEEQIGHVEAHGGRVILMASRALCRIFAIRKLSRPMTDRLSNLAGTLAHDVVGQDGVTASGRQHQLSRIGPSLGVTVTRGRPGPHTNRTYDVSTSPSHEVVHEPLRSRRDARTSRDPTGPTTATPFAIEGETSEGPAVLSLSPAAVAVLAEELQGYLKTHWFKDMRSAVAPIRSKPNL